MSQTKMDMTELLKQFLAAQTNGGTVTLPIPAAPAPTPTPELAAVSAELTVAPTAAPTVTPVIPQSPPPAPTNGGRKGWSSCDVTLEGGEKLHLRVAPKGYGCFGFEGRGDYACVYGYKGRMNALATVFGDGFRKVVYDRLVEMGMKDMPNGND